MSPTGKRKERAPLAANHASARPFWETTPLDDLRPSQWERLCDRCGRCCLEKLTNRRNGKVYYTSIGCRLLDPVTCHCRDYRHRHRKVPHCLPLTLAILPSCRWLPRTCAYRLLWEGKPLPDWHPLVSGDPESVHTAGISIRGRRLHAMPPNGEDIERYIVDWGFWGKKASPR